MMFQCISLLIFDILVKPFEDPVLNHMVIFNELCILAVSYHLIVFTPFVDNIDVQYNAGWSVIAITVLNILVNMVVMLVFTIKMLKVILLRM